MQVERRYAYSVLGDTPGGRRRYYAWDIDPTERNQKPGVDRIERDLTPALAHSPLVLGTFAATSQEVYDKAQAGYDRILGPARDRIDREHIERFSRQLARIFNFPPGRRPDLLRSLMRPELQCAANLVSRAAPALAEQMRALGYDWTADYLHALIDSEVEEFVIPLSERVLGELGDQMLGLLARGAAGPEQVEDLLFGMSGLRVAYLALFGTLKSMPIWHKTAAVGA